MIMSWVDVMMARLARQWSKRVSLSESWLKVALFHLSKLFWLQYYRSDCQSIAGLTKSVILSGVPYWQWTLTQQDKYSFS